MKKSKLLLSLALFSLTMTAAIPDGYYDRLEGLNGVSLKKAAKAVAKNHTVISYGDNTWDAFRKTDVTMINGREAWWDMYSNDVVYVSTGHGGLNIEHSVPNSWWDGDKNAAYKDLFHLNPSNATANNRKGNFPLAELQSVTWENGVTFVGKPVSGQGGGSSNAYEPADRYKGDFARTYMYMFTIYDDIAWGTRFTWMYDTSSDLLLRPWAYNLLLKWDHQDPIDDKERNRNEAIYLIQKNRNPFIDLPGLGDYIWGDKRDIPFHASGEISAAPTAPVFDGYTRNGNEFTGTWWEPVVVTISAARGEIRYSIDGGPYKVYTDGIEFEQAEEGEVHQIRALAATYTDDDEELISAVSTLTLTASDPTVAPPSVGEGLWNLVTSSSQLTEDGLYVITDTAGSALMGWDLDKSFFSAAGSPDFAGSDHSAIKSVGEDVAVITLTKSGNGWRMGVADTAGDFKGEIVSTSAKTVGLANNKGGGSVATISISGSTSDISFGSAGKLQYNANAPRFTTYTSSQKPLSLYKYEAPKARPAAPGFYAIDQDGEELKENAFSESCTVELTAGDGCSILYTLDGSVPAASAGGATISYSAPIELSETTTVKAVAVKDGERSSVATRKFTLVPTVGLDAVYGDFIPVAVSGRNIIAPVSARIFDVYGTPCEPENLEPGIYIVALGRKSVKVIIR